MRIELGALALMSSASLLPLASNALAADETAAATGSPVSEVVVTAPRKEDQARVVQFLAPNLISVQSAETIQKYPDFNAAEALGRMPGISLSSDTGEGRFVQIRGIDANLDGATYGGVPLLNTNPGGTESGGGGRAVEYDTIPTGAVDGIIVTYTLLPDHEAEGLGGSIELTPRTAANVTKPFLDATLGWGYEPLHDHTGPFEADVALGARFGFNDKGLVIQNGEAAPGPPRADFISNPTPFSFVLTYSTNQDRRAVDDLEETYNGDPAANIIKQYDLRHYDYHRRRFSYGGELDFQPNEDHRYYLRADVAGYTEAQKKNFLLFTGIAVAGTDPNDANGFIGTTIPAITLTDEEEVHRNTVVALGGEDRWGDVLLDYHGAYSRATFHVRRNIGAEFDGPTVPFTYDPVSTAPYPIFGFPAGTNLNDASMYFLNGGSLGNQHIYDADEEYSGAVNLTVPVHLVNGSDRIKIGGEVRLRDKTEIEYDDNFATPPPLSLTGFSGPAIAPYYNGHYTNGPVIDRYAIRALLGTLYQNTTFNPGSYQADTENIYAGYAQYTTTIGKVGILAGVRVEDTEATYGAYQSVTDASGNTTLSFITRPSSYINAFPTVQLRYDFTPRLVARLTYSTGIARPGFNQNTAATTIDFTQSPIAISRGNPNLKPTTGNNFDFSLEYYLPNAGIIQFAAFDKEFTNYIVPRDQLGVTTDPAAPGQLANVATFLNVSDAWARGISLAYHQKFTWLPKPLDGVGLEGNFTYVDSHILEYTAAQAAANGFPAVDQSGLLPGTSPVTWNVAAFYEAYGIDLRLAGEYVSHSLFSLGGAKALDTVQDSRFTLDLSSSYKINNNWTVYFNAKNLTNQPLRYYEGYVDRPIQREFYDITLEGGVRAHF